MVGVEEEKVVFFSRKWVHDTEKVYVTKAVLNFCNPFFFLFSFFLFSFFVFFSLFPLCPTLLTSSSHPLPTSICPLFPTAALAPLSLYLMPPFPPSSLSLSLPCSLSSFSLCSAAQ